MQTSHWIRYGVCAAILVLANQGAAWAEGVLARGVTLPSRVVERSFTMPGTVAESHVRDGDRVEAGQILFVLDDKEEVQRQRILTLRAESDVNIEASRQELAMATERLGRLERIIASAGPNAVSPGELEEARLAVEIARLRVQAAEEDRQEKQLQLEHQNIVIDRMRLTSPIDGIVERISAVEGQRVDPARASCVVVQIDPLWVEVRQLRAAQIAHLKPGQTVQVRHPDDSEWSDARIIFISLIGDPASGTQLVRLEMPNQGGRASGQEVQVRVPSAEPAQHARAVEN